MADYQYNESAFVGLTAAEINLTCLHSEILASAISPEVLDGIERDSGFVTFTFDIALDTGDEAILDGLVAAHTGGACEDQQDVYFPCCVEIENNLTVGGDIFVTGTVDGVDIGSPKNSIEVDAEQYQLVGDEASPGNDKVYGTSAIGVKGWFDKLVAGTGGATGRLNSWTLDSGDLYYQDFVHGFETKDIVYLLREYANDEEVRPEKFDIIDLDTVRVYVRGNTEDLQINVVTGQGPQGPAGPAGADGADGADGVGVPAGGTAGQHLAKIDATDYNTEWVSAGSGDVSGPGISVDNELLRWDGITGTVVQGYPAGQSVFVTDAGELNVVSTTSLYNLYLTNNTNGGNFINCQNYNSNDALLLQQDVGGDARLLVYQDDGTIELQVDNTGLNTATGHSYKINGAIVNVPAGGTAGQRLEKIDGTDYNVQWADPGAGSGDVTAAANLSDNSIIRGDGGGKGVQDSDNATYDWTIDDDGKMLGIANQMEGEYVLTLRNDVASGEFIQCVNLNGNPAHEFRQNLSGDGLLRIYMNGVGGGNQYFKADSGVVKIGDTADDVDYDFPLWVVRDDAGYAAKFSNTLLTGGGNGFCVTAGEALGDIAFHIADANDTFQIMEMEADQGFITLGKTYAQTITDNSRTWGIDIQHTGSAPSNATDFNTEVGNYRIGGDILNETPPPVDHTGAGTIVSATVDTNAFGFGAALYMAADGNFDTTDADSATTMPCRALALESGVGTKKVLLRGFIRDDSWTWTPGDDVWISTTTGALTQTRPTGTGDQVQKIGFAWSADVIYFQPGDYTVVEVP